MIDVPAGATVTAEVCVHLSYCLAVLYLYRIRSASQWHHFINQTTGDPRDPLDPINPTHKGPVLAYLCVARCSSLDPRYPHRDARTY